MFLPPHLLRKLCNQAILLDKITKPGQIDVEGSIEGHIYDNIFMEFDSFNFQFYSTLHEKNKFIFCCVTVILFHFLTFQNISICVLSVDPVTKKHTKKSKQKMIEFGRCRAEMILTFHIIMGLSHRATCPPLFSLARDLQIITWKM